MPFRGTKASRRSVAAPTVVGKAIGRVLGHVLVGAALAHEEYRVNRCLGGYWLGRPTAQPSITPRRRGWCAGMFGTARRRRQTLVRSHHFGHGGLERGRSQPPRARERPRHLVMCRGRCIRSSRPALQWTWWESNPLRWG
jgi:hypothetical protein